MDRINELEQKIKVYQDEIHKKDELIQKLSSMDIGQIKSVEQKPNNDANKEDQQTCIKREELAALRSRVEQLCDKTLNQESELKAKSTLLTKTESDLLKLTHKKDELIAENEKLKKQLNDNTKCIDTKIAENEICNKKLNELNQLLKSEQNKTEELKKRLNKQIEEKEKSDYELTQNEKRLETFTTKMIHIFDTLLQNDEHLTINCRDEKKLEELITKAKDVVSENLKSKGHIQELLDKLKQRENENAEQKYSVNRLGELLTKNDRYEKENRDLNQELEYIRHKEKSLEERIRVLNKELIDSQLHIRELDKQLQETRNKNEKHHWINQNKYDEDNSQLFRNSLASLLQCNPTEISIKESIRKFMSEFHEQKDLCSRLEVRLSDALNRLDHSQASKHEIERMLEKTERECFDSREQIRRLETDLINSDLVKQEQRSDKLKIFSYLCKLAAKVKIDEKVASGMRFDELQEVLSTRIGQITSGEYAMLSDIQANADRVNGLKRKVKRLQDQLASREIQLGLWKEKASKLEDRLSSMNDTEMVAHANKIAAEKSAINARRSELEVSRLKEELTRLKAELLDFSDAKINVVKYEEQLSELSKLNKELEGIRQSQATKIAELTEKMELQTNEDSDNRNRLEEECRHLMNELQTTRKSLEQFQRSERELLEFRALVGRLLGLDTELLTVPNYDIISRLETLVTQYQFVHDNSMLSRTNDAHSPNRKSRSLTKESELQRNATMDCYMAGPHTAKTRSKQAWINTCEDYSKLHNQSFGSVTDSVDKYREKCYPSVCMKHDPRKY
ncbi:Coiled-coil domain-containing protein [Schistosoma japonicum]|nr:Coiled-coil domain-containing protein [Schistosoma japonicum]